MNFVFFTTYGIIQTIILAGLGLATAYILFFSIAGLFYKQRKEHKSDKIRRFAVLIPGYKEDEVIIDVAREALNQSYGNENYDVVIIADSFQPQTLVQLKELPIKVIEVSFDKSTKAKALNKAMEQLNANYDIALVLDADNIMEYRFIEKLNMAFDYDFIAVQGHRAAKNLDTGLAVLDAISEEINNHIFRKGHRAVGLASAIIGSGMAFRYDYFKKIMKTVHAVGGFDKEIELIMLKDGKNIEYLQDAYVYDEKVQTSDVFTNQRRRWLSAQFFYFRKDIGSATWHLLTRHNINYFDKAMQFIQPPRILLLGMIIMLTPFFITTNYLLNADKGYLTCWILLVVGCITAFALSIPKHYYTATTAKAVLDLPKGMLLMLGALLKIKGANKQFLHTKHTATKK